jgi:hypothetical protein
MLTHARPKATYSRDTLRTFALDLAKNDARQRPRTYVADDVITDAISGHALCFANAHRIEVTLSTADLTYGLNAYRRARGQRRPVQHIAKAAALPLLRVMGRNSVA